MAALALCAGAAQAVEVRAADVQTGMAQASMAQASPVQVSPVQAVRVDFSGARAPVSADARYIADWIGATQDTRGLPFVIVDKKSAQIMVFNAEGRLVGQSAALLGLAYGDEGVPGIGQRKLADIRPHERTTPAGRFMSVPGRNLQGESVVWVDYGAGIAIHRVRTSNPQERRPQRLASPGVDDNRISLGCVVVSLPFFENVVEATMGHSRGVVYVLPETRPVEAMFPSH